MGKNIIYQFHCTEVIPGIQNAALYKIPERRRFIISSDVAKVLALFSNRPFLISSLETALLGMGGAGAAKKFIDYLLREDLIRPSSKAVAAKAFVHLQEAALLRNRKINHVALELTDFCNFSCPHCSPNSGKKHANHLMPVEAVKRIVAWAQAAGIGLSFTGGEPLLHPNIEEIFNEVSKTKVPTEITSNGSVLSTSVVSAIVKSGVDVRISLYGQDDYYKAFAPNGVTLGKVKENILLLRNVLGKRLSCVLPTMKHNLHALQDRINFCKDHNIFYQVSLVSPFGRALCKWDRIKIGRGLMKSIRDEYDAYAKKYNARYRKNDAVSQKRPHFFPCSMDQVNVLADGKITPCLSMRNLYKGYYDFAKPASQLESIFKSARFVNLQRSFAANRRSVCRDCELKYECGGGCPAHAFSVLGTIDAPDPMCENHPHRVLLRLWKSNMDKRRGDENKQADNTPRQKNG